MREGTGAADIWVTGPLLTKYHVCADVLRGSPRATIAVTLPDAGHSGNATRSTVFNSSAYGRMLPNHCVSSAITIKSMSLTSCFREETLPAGSVHTNTRDSGTKDVASHDMLNATAALDVVVNVPLVYLRRMLQKHTAGRGRRTASCGHWWSPP